MSGRFKFERGQKLSNSMALKVNVEDWLKGLHCEVTNRVYDVDAAMECYVVHEYLRTDYQPQGEKRIISVSQLEAEYEPWTGYAAWNKAHGC